MSAKKKRTVRAVEVRLATHRAIAGYAKRQGIGISEAADALVTSGLRRLDACARDRERKKKAPPRAVVEAASDEERKEHAHAVAEAPPAA